MIPRGDDRITPYTTDVLYHGEPDWVYRARDFKDLQEILRYCDQEKIPVTVSGSRTALTGAGIAEEGILVAMEKKNRLLEIGLDPVTKVPSATAEPGILLGEFQRQIREAGYFYPPDPTSRNDAQLGGTIGTNATGEDALLYGPTRKYVRRLKILKANGEEIILERKQPYRGSVKNRAGYFLGGDLIDLFVGSEGTLGIVTEVTVDLLPAERPFFAGWAFFPDLHSGLEFVVAALNSSSIKPRALELIDNESLRIVATKERAPSACQTADCAITFKQEYSDEQEMGHRMEGWLHLLEGILNKRNAAHLVNEIAIAMDEPAQQNFRLLRHAIPASANEEGRRYQVNGGGKIATDWWVPVEKIQEMMGLVEQESRESGIRYLAYAHIGDGHPHLNYITKNADEKRRANGLLIRQCERAVKLGGGVAGEHGVGKLFRNLLPIQYRSTVVQEMKKIKLSYDPHQILGRGNLWSLD